ALLVRTPHGQARVPYELDKRHKPTDGFQGFTSADVMYLIMPDRYSDGDPSNDRLDQAPGTFDPSNPLAYHGGDLRGIENHLDYIQKLGATTLWITPIYAQDPLSQDYDGYEPFNLYRVNPHFGTLESYQELAAAVHSHGMKLVLDIVANHVSPKSPWVLDPPTPDWFHGTQANHLAASDNFGSITDPHAAPAASSPVVDGWFRDVLPDLNQSNPLVKQYLIQNAVWWVESGTLDGLRLDTFPYVDRSFWQEFHAVLHALYPNLTTVGEVYSPDPTVVSYFDGGVKRAGIDTGVDTLFDFPSYFALRAILAGTSPAGGAPMTMLKSVDRLDWLYPHAGQLVTFLGNQDTGRFLAEEGASPARLRLAFGLLATMRGMPQIYAGDEVAMPGSNADNRHDFPGGFPGDTNNAFTATGRTPQQEAMHVWVQGLLALRAHHAALQSGAQQDLLADESGFVFARIEAPQVDQASTSKASSDQANNASTQGEIALVLVNKSNSSRTFHLDFTRTALEGANNLAPLWNTSEQVAVNQNQCDISVAPEQLIVFAVQR
ncbi:MAG: alpha-amylase family glycosyl hydrolase, partial [Acidobacteriaceae bacterium]